MRNGYAWSGGPWVIDHWTKGQEIKLIPNPTFWGKRPNLDAVVFKVITDSAAYLAAFKTGQLDMAFIEGPSAEVLELKALPDTHFDVTLSTAFEFVMFNVTKTPLDSRSVRQALAYATDRDAIVGQLYGGLAPGFKAAQAFMSPANGQWYSEPFAVYRRDLSRVTQLMTGDGWAKDGDGIWAKGGSRAVIELNAANGNRRRELTEQILQSQWKEAGFGTVVNNPAQQVFSGEWIPKGMFTAGLFGMVPTSVDPNMCRQFCSQSIPTEANGFQGADVSHLSSRTVDELGQRVASELDDGRRLELVRQAHRALADEVPFLPISGGVNITVFNAAKVAGPVKANSVGRAFYNLNEWYCQACH
jgi:peptide/nickel transport system substrate-binding protein